MFCGIGLTNAQLFELSVIEYKRNRVCYLLDVHVHVCFSVVPKISNVLWYYRKFPKYSDTQKICCNHPKIRTTWPYK